MEYAQLKEMIDAGLPNGGMVVFIRHTHYQGDAWIQGRYHLIDWQELNREGRASITDLATTLQETAKQHNRIARLVVKYDSPLLELNNLADIVVLVGFERAHSAEPGRRVVIEKWEGRPVLVGEVFSIG